MLQLISQLNEQKHKVDFNTYDISVKELINMVREGYIDIAPDYQRQFRWDEQRQSKLIESVLLGIPIPNLFMATNRDSTWELIDGVQRLSSLIRFAGQSDVKEKVGIKGTLKLKGLEKLNEFNNKMFENLPRDIQMQFELKPIKITTLSDKSDVEVRFDLFERLNSGGVKLSDQEIRSCIIRGRFNDFIRKLSSDKYFRDVVKLPTTKESDGTLVELVLRFFAYLNYQDSFKHSVKDFLTKYMEEANKHFDYTRGELDFIQTFKFLSEKLTAGIHRNNRNQTPIVLFEAVTVGTALALREKPNLSFNGDFEEFIGNNELKTLTTGATNSRPRIAERIDYVRRNIIDNAV